MAAQEKQKASFGRILLIVILSAIVLLPVGYVLLVQSYEHDADQRSENWDRSYASASAIEAKNYAGIESVSADASNGEPGLEIWADENKAQSAGNSIYQMLQENNGIQKLTKYRSTATAETGLDPSLEIKKKEFPSDAEGWSQIAVLVLNPVVERTTIDKDGVLFIALAEPDAEKSVQSSVATDYQNLGDYITALKKFDASVGVPEGLSNVTVSTLADLTMSTSKVSISVPLSEYDSAVSIVEAAQISGLNFQTLSIKKSGLQDLLIVEADTSSQAKIQNFWDLLPDKNIRLNVYSESHKLLDTKEK